MISTSALPPRLITLIIIVISGFHGKYWSVRNMNTALLKCELLAVEVMYVQLVPYPGFPHPHPEIHGNMLSCEARLSHVRVWFAGL